MIIGRSHGIQFDEDLPATRDSRAIRASHHAMTETMSCGMPMRTPRSKAMVESVDHIVVEECKSEDEQIGRKTWSASEGG